MVADQIARKPDRPRAVARRGLQARRAQERRFWIGVGLAAVVHAALLVGAGRSAMHRQLGEPDQSPDGISVELVDAADLMSKTNVNITPDNPPANPASAAPPPPAPPEAEHPPAPAPEPKKSAALEKAPDKSSVPEPTKKQSSTEPHPKTKTASLPHSDPLLLSLPDASYAPPGRSAAFARPPGYTRSGENDDFGRGVIRALRQTMPASSTLSQVTVRLLLSDKGNLVEVRLIRSGGDPILDQNVLFAVKQSNFPIPPIGAPEVDRTFLVTYVYR